ncbi:MAG TPA: thermonuclease family protein [Caulobacteraceae bacterium]|jgi:endonuclease YncB( thermonuclease family)
MAYLNYRSAQVLPLRPRRRSWRKRSTLPGRLALAAATLLALAFWTLFRAADAPPAEPAAPSSATLIQGPARVIDGDTLEVNAERIRLHGIDAVERDQTCLVGGASWNCGQAASAALQTRIGSAEVSCEVLDHDRYGRHVARCRSGGEDLGAWMVAQGHAVAYRRYSGDYVDQERRARLARLGVWAGEFTLPETYRHS